MGFKRRTPEGGKGRDTWSFVSTGAGEKWTGWLAGQTEWFECHRCPQSKPCAACFTDGELPCSYCKRGWAPYWWGYVPLYREADGKAVLVGVRDGMYDVLRALKRLNHVQVSRKAAGMEAVSIQPLASGRDYVPYRGDRQVGPNLWPYLFRLWKLPALEAWWVANPPEGIDAARSVELARRSSASVPVSDTPAGEQLTAEIQARVDRAFQESQQRSRKLPPTMGESLNGKQ